MPFREILNGINPEKENDMGSYFSFLLAVLVCGMISALASAKVHRTYDDYGKINTRYGLTGYDVATRLLRSGGVTDVSVGRSEGKLTDHYHPAQAKVNLSEATYDISSVAAAAVAAHEVGHVMQNKQGYLFYRVRTLLVPMVNFGSRLAMPLVLVGLLIDGGLLAARNTNLGYYLAMLGVGLYGAAFLFTVVTLPVEFNASYRAKEMLRDEGILTDEEMAGAGKVLSAAAMTYLAAMFTSLVYFLRFIFFVTTMFGRRRE